LIVWIDGFWGIAGANLRSGNQTMQIGLCWLYFLVVNWVVLIVHPGLAARFLLNNLFQTWHFLMTVWTKPVGF